MNDGSLIGLGIVVCVVSTYEMIREKTGLRVARLWFAMITDTLYVIGSAMLIDGGLGAIGLWGVRAMLALITVAQISIWLYLRVHVRHHRIICDIHRACESANDIEQLVRRHTQARAKHATGQIP